jgi:predicted dehydrogenase
MKSLVIGMGIGQLYKTVLLELGHTVITVDADPKKGADFYDYGFAFAAHGHFDTVHVCTPNFTHVNHARHAAIHDAGIVFVEKPGLENSSLWAQMCEDFPNTRFMMVKNNQWRDNIAELKSLAEQAKTVNLNWINKDRVPNPGTWFTTKELAFGGVSRDLIPHLLSLYIALNPVWRTDNVNKIEAERKWQLNELTTTDYGQVKADGVYDVDDVCRMTFTDKWNLTANWRSMEQDQRNIEFVMQDNTIETFELGLCPEYAYKEMIRDAVANLNNIKFWKNQYDQDMWIHQLIENV